MLTIKSGNYIIRLKPIAITDKIKLEQINTRIKIYYFW